MTVHYGDPTIRHLCFTHILYVLIGSELSGRQSYQSQITMSVCVSDKQTKQTQADSAEILSLLDQMSCKNLKPRSARVTQQPTSSHLILATVGD